MERPSRRRLLAAVAASTALAGCNADDTGTESDESTPAPTDTATATPTPADTPLVTSSETPTPAPVTASELEFVGSVIRQPSSEAPGRVHASLTNHAGRTMEVLGGDPLPVSNAVDAGPDDALLLYPDRADRINEYQWTDAEQQGLDAVTYDGCWRAPSGLIQTAMGSVVDLSAGLSVAADYTPLGFPDTDCPAGTYTAAEELTLRRSAQTLTLELDVTVAADGDLATDARLSVGE